MWQSILGQLRGRYKGFGGSYTEIQGQRRTGEDKRKHGLPSAPSRHGRRRSATGWTPRSLSTTALVANAGVFACFTVALGLIYHFAKDGDGLHTITNSHYTWVYGPTAVLVVFVSIWRQVDFHTKSLVAWSELKQGNASADRTVLLDYASRTLPMALYRAARAKHFSVVITILAFVILKVTTVASTGLLYATDIVAGTRSADLVKTTTLSGPTVDVSNASIVDSRSDSSVFYTSHAIMNLGLAPPEGISNGVLYETFKQSGARDIANATFAAQVSGFYPQMHCETFKASVNTSSSEFDGNNANKALKIVSEDDACRWPWYSGQSIPACAIDSRSCPSRQIRPLVWVLENCDGDMDLDVDAGQPGKVLLLLADVRYNQTWNGTAPTVGDTGLPIDWTFDIVDTKALLCQVTYSVNPTWASYNNENSETSITIVKNQTVANNSLSGFSHRDLAEQFGNALNAAYKVFGESDTFAEETPDPYFGLMMRNATANYVDFLNDPTILAKAAENVFATMGVLVGRKFLSHPSIEVFNGTVEYHEQRLFVQTLSLGLVLTGFLLMMSAAILMLFLRPVRATQDSPSSIAYIAHVLKHSSNFRRQIQAVIGHDRKTAKQMLRHGHYTSAVNQENGAMSIVGDSLVARPASDGTENSETWWRPMSLTWPFLVLTGLSAIAVIATLEGIQRTSDRSDGLFTLQSPTSFQIGAYTRFLPALVMLGVGSMYNSLDFNALLLAPYSAMKARPATRALVSESLLSKMPPVVLYTALKHRQWAACLTTIATLVGSGLTIVVSGLYTFETTSISQPQSLTRLDGWNTTFSNSFLTDNSSTIVLSLIESANVSYPTHTYNELALPNFGSISAGNTSLVGTLNARLPALRGKLSCVTINSSNYNTSCSGYKGVGPATNCYLSATVELPAACQRGGPYGNLSTVNLRDTFAPDQVFARMASIHVGPYDKINGDDTDERGRLDEQPDNPPECPSLAFYWGQTNSIDPTKSVVTLLYCNQELESVDADVTIAMPGLRVLESHTFEESATVLHSGPNNETGFPWRIQNHFDNSFEVFQVNSTVNTTTAGTSISAPIDQFFQGVLYGRTPLPNATLVEEQNEGLVFEHIHMLYRRYMAQFISTNLRSTAVDDANVATFPATLVPAPGAAQRFVQHSTPKSILQIMMGVMLACSICAYFVGHFHRVVPWNPCSIAGVAILVADSKLCQTPSAAFENDDIVRPPSTRDGAWSGVSAQSEWSMKSPPAYIRKGTWEDSQYDTAYLGQSDEVMKQDRGRRPYEGVEMMPLSSKVSPLLSRGSQPAVAPENDMYSNVNDIDLSTTRFRLGYWHNGRFMKSRRASIFIGKERIRESSSVLESDTASSIEGKGDKWRYGVDVL